VLIKIFTLYTKYFYCTKLIKHIVSHFILVYLLFFGTYSKFIPKINNNYLLMLAISKAIGLIPNSEFINTHRFVINFGTY